MDMPTELIYGLIFAAVLLLQYVMKRFGLLPTPDAEPRQAPLPQESAEQEAPLADSPERAPSTPAPSPALPGRAAWLEAPVATAAATSTAGRATLLLGNRQDLQRAVLSMTVLGPCRALERPDDR